MDQSTPKPKWSWRTILLIAVVAVMAYVFGFRHGQRALIRNADTVTMEELMSISSNAPAAEKR